MKNNINNISKNNILLKETKNNVISKKIKLNNKKLIKFVNNYKIKPIKYLIIKID